MRTMFEAAKNYMSSFKASSCTNASFNHAQVMSLSTMLVVLILMVLINMIIPIIISYIKEIHFEVYYAFFLFNCLHGYYSQ